MKQSKQKMNLAKTSATSQTISTQTTEVAPETDDLELDNSFMANRDIHRILHNPQALTPGNLLQLQRVIGNKAANRFLRAKTQPRRTPPAVVARAAKETATNYLSYAEFFTKLTDLDSLETYAKKQADWHASPSLKDNERDEIRDLLSFSREPNIRAACGRMTIKSVRDLMVADKKNLDHLKEYSGVVTAQAPIELAPVADAKTAIEMGDALTKLRAAVGDETLVSAMTEHWFKQLVTRKLVGDFITYAALKPAPIFQAQAGADVRSYLILKVNDAKNPVDYAATSLKDRVRNYHRFSKVTLDKLNTNYGDTSKAKPLTLILHTAIDHNGAFHRDPNLDALVTNANLHVLMVEGKETLADMKAEIGPLAKKYGKNDKVDQVMIAGHGNARSMQLGGKVKANNGKLEEVTDSISLDNNKANTEALFDEILLHMDKQDPALAATVKTVGTTPALQPHRRVVLNACLTNSNRVGGKVTSVNVDDARKEVADYIKNNPSLATYLQQRADAGKYQVKAVGANASFGQVGLVNPKDELDIISSGDKYITATKLEYLEHGTEPLGVIRAAQESWANAQNKADQKKVEEAMTRRKNKAVTAWDDVIVKAIYTEMLGSFKDNANAYTTFAAVAGLLSHLKIEAECRTDLLARVIAPLTKDLAKNFFTALSGSDEWKANKYIPLVVFQGWLQLDNSKRADFLTLLETGFTCRTAKKYVNIDYLGGEFKDLLKGGVSEGRTKLALLGVLPKTLNPDCKKYLEDQVGADNKFPAALKVAGVLDGLGTEDSILIKIGKLANPADATATTTTTPTVKADPDANLSIKGDTTNKVYVRSLTGKGKILADNTGVYHKPEDAATEDTKLAKDTSVYIVGKSEDSKFWAIEHTFSDKKRGTGFVKAAELSLTP